MLLRIGALAALATGAAFAANVPVVVELFTSEGCSSCPPADLLLSRLQQNTMSGIEVIALEQHVDYWNNLGWRDPFSSPAFTTRQQQYSRLFGGDTIYTPQMIVDGHAQFVGSDARRAASEVRDAAQRPRTTVDIAPAESGALRIHVDALSGNESADVMLAITEDRLISDVRAGENSGRKLPHASVVRSMTLVGRIEPKKSNEFAIDTPVTVDKAWKRENLRAVVFVQERTTRRIVGAMSIALPSPSAKSAAATRMNSAGPIASR